MTYILTGNCHIYVEKNADLNMATEILINAKTSRPSVCNAEEVLLVHKDVYEEFLPKLKAVGSISMENSSINSLPKLKEAGIRDKVKVMIGGSPISQKFADEIGADGYSTNAVEAVKLAERLLA